jgi:hypothetical protein
LGYSVKDPPQITMSCVKYESPMPVSDMSPKKKEPQETSLLPSVLHILKVGVSSASDPGLDQ